MADDAFHSPQTPVVPENHKVFHLASHESVAGPLLDCPAAVSRRPHSIRDLKATPTAWQFVYQSVLQCRHGGRTAANGKVGVLPSVTPPGGDADFPDPARQLKQQSIFSMVVMVLISKKHDNAHVWLL